MSGRVTALAGAALGVIAVVGNVSGVVLLTDRTSAYRPGAIPAWVDETLRLPDAACASAAAFTIGLVALAGWAWILGERLGATASRAGGALIAIGAVVDAAGTLAPIVLARHVAPATSLAEAHALGAALLGGSLALDALFNVTLALGLAGFALAAWRRSRAWRLLACLAIVAAVATAPVAAQIVSDAAARLLMIAAPVWLAFVVATSVALAVEDAK